jgi:hypothetical protein
VRCAMALAAITEVADTRQNVLASGATAPLLAALRAHGADPALAAEALAVFAFFSLDAVARPALLLAGILIETFAMLDTHPSDAVVCRRATAILANMSCDEPALQPMLDGRAIPRIVIAMAAHRAVAELQVFSCIALEALCTTGVAAREQAAAEGVRRSVVTAADDHLTHLGVQLSGTRVCFQLCAEAHARPEMIACGVARVVVAGMVRAAAEAPALCVVVTDGVSDSLLVLCVCAGRPCELGAAGICGV